MATGLENAPNRVRAWFIENPGRTTLHKVASALGGTWDNLSYEILDGLLSSLVNQGFLERVDALDRESGVRRQYWQRPHGAERPQDGDPGEIPGIIRLDNASYDAVVQKLEESPGPNEAMKKLFAEAPVFSNLSDGDDPRGHASTETNVCLHPPMWKADPELARQAAEATRRVLAKKDNDDFVEWVRAQFERFDQRIDKIEKDFDRLEEAVDRLTNGLEEKIGVVWDRVLSLPEK